MVVPSVELQAIVLLPLSTPPDWALPGINNVPLFPPAIIFDLHRFSFFVPFLLTSPLPCNVFCELARVPLFFPLVSSFEHPLKRFTTPSLYPTPLPYQWLTARVYFLVHVCQPSTSMICYFFRSFPPSPFLTAKGGAPEIFVHKIPSPSCSAVPSFGFLSPLT